MCTSAGEGKGEGRGQHQGDDDEVAAEVRRLGPEGGRGASERARQQHCYVNAPTVHAIVV